MGMISILVDNNVKIGDIVTVINKDVNYKLTSRNFNISPYVFLTNLNRSLPRKYIKNNKIIEEIEG